MRNEFGLGAGQISMNQFYGKPGLPTTGQISFSGFYGKSNYIDTQSITVGSYVSAPYTIYGYQKSMCGSISDGVSDIFSREIIQIRWINLTGQLLFTLASIATNSGFSKMVVGSTSFDRTAASYSTSGSMSTWTWGAPSNPFSAVGSVTSVGFTA